MLLDQLSHEDQKTLEARLADTNLERVPALGDLVERRFALILRDELGHIVGGSCADLRWGYLYPDTVWIDSRRRGLGEGQRLMDATEAVAASFGVTRAYLMTASFQARPFYEKLGYAVFGHNAERPCGHSIYYLHKQELQAAATPDAAFELQIPPQEADLLQIERGLIAHAAHVAPLNPQHLGISLFEDGRFVGGLHGYTWWDHFDLHAIWVDTPLRGQGFGRAMMLHALRICQQRQIHAVIAEVADFQDQAFFIRLGFERFGRLADRPPGHNTDFLRLPVSEELFS